MKAAPGAMMDALATAMAAEPEIRRRAVRRLANKLDDDEEEE